jgi:hypothetical protein
MWKMITISSITNIKVLNSEGFIYHTTNTRETQNDKFKCYHLIFRLIYGSIINVTNEAL